MKVPEDSGVPQPKAETLPVATFGLWVAVATGVSTLITFCIAIATPPLSGQLCRVDCFSYPYLDIVTRFPRDYYWLFAAIPACLLFVPFTIALHARVPPAGRPWGQLGLALSAMAALTLVGDYFVQLAVIQPSVLAAETDGISLLTQYNPHGVFIALEELGYLLMSLSLVCMTTSLSRSRRLERTIRRLFVGGFGVNMIALCWLMFGYGHARGYLFEIAVISVDWLVLIIGAFMAAVVFGRDRIEAVRSDPDPSPSYLGLVKRL